MSDQLVTTTGVCLRATEHGIVGSRSTAKKEASGIRSWLKTHLTDVDVVMAKWGNAR